MAQRKLTDEERRAQARAKFSRTGLTIKKWAEDLGVSDRLVTEVLAGRKKCLRGKSHKIAVALGLKDGVIVPEGTDPITAIRMGEEVRS
jgi:gp16 family phage-associated protein